MGVGVGVGVGEGDGVITRIVGVGSEKPLGTGVGEPPNPFCPKHPSSINTPLKTAAAANILFIDLFICMVLLTGENRPEYSVGF